MKYLHHIFIGLAALVSLSACQVIPEADRLVEMGWQDVPMLRNVLLVEFTGLSCKNCPEAAAEAHGLLQVCPDNLVVVAMHPKANDFTHTSNAKFDFTCPEADTYYTYFGGTASTPFPTGVINMNREQGFTDYQAWTSSLLRELVRPAEAEITLDKSLSKDGLLTADIHVSAPLLSSTDSISVLLWLVEDGVIGAQRQPGGDVIADYEHNHMLRAELLSEDGWGRRLPCREATSVHLEPLDIKPLVKQHLELCSLVVVVLHDADVLNVLQAKL